MRISLCEGQGINTKDGVARKHSVLTEIIDIFTQVCKVCIHDEDATKASFEQRETRVRLESQIFDFDISFFIKIICQFQRSDPFSLEVKKGDYGTVVVGRRGVNRAFFMGSVSKYVLNHTEGRALWVVS